MATWVPLVTTGNVNPLYPWLKRCPLPADRVTLVMNAQDIPMGISIHEVHGQTDRIEFRT